MPVEIVPLSCGLCPGELEKRVGCVDCSVRRQNFCARNCERRAHRCRFQLHARNIHLSTCFCKQSSRGLDLDGKLPILETACATALVVSAAASNYVLLASLATVGATTVSGQLLVPLASLSVSFLDRTCLHGGHLRQLVQTINPNECAAYFKAAGYASV